MASYTCEYYVSGIKISDVTFTLPDEVTAEILQDGTIYFEFDAQVVFRAYGGVRESLRFATHETGLDLCLQIGAGKCSIGSIVFTIGSNTYIDTPLDKRLYAYFGKSESSTQPVTISAAGRWKVRIGESSLVKTWCLYKDSKGVFFWFRIENFSTAWALIWTNFGRYLSSYRNDVCHMQNRDMYIKVYLPFAAKVESVYFKPSNSVSAGTEVEIWAKLTNLTGAPFDSVFKLSAVSRKANRKVFDVRTAIHVETGTKDYLVGRITYCEEDELIVYFESLPQSLFVKGSTAGEVKVCYYQSVGNMTCITQSTAKFEVRNLKVYVDNRQIDPSTERIPVGKTVTVTAEVWNTSQILGTATVRYKLNDAVVKSESVTIYQGYYSPVSLNIALNKIGINKICVEVV